MGANPNLPLKIIGGEKMLKKMRIPKEIEKEIDNVRHLLYDIVTEDFSILVRTEIPEEMDAVRKIEEGKREKIRIAISKLKNIEKKFKFEESG